MTPLEPKISVEYTEKAAIVTIAAEKILEDSDIKALGDSITDVIEQSKDLSIIIDFSNVSFLSSAVLGLLIRLSKRIYEKQGRLQLCNINPKIYQVFKITRLTKVFEIYKDVESAVEDIE